MMDVESNTVTSPLLSSSQNNEYDATDTTSSSMVGDSNPDDDDDASRRNTEKRYGWFSCRPSWLQCCNNPNGFLIWVCGFALTQSYVTSGLVFTVTTTLEQRFSLPSVQTGFLASCYDIALIIVVLVVTYFGERGNRPLWLGCGALIFAAGSFIFALPQFTTGIYQPATLYSDTCDLSANQTDYCDASDDGLSSYFWVFIAAQCLHGLGAAPIYTLGVTYLDESVAPHLSSIYIGIIQSTSILGPAMGYLLGAYFLTIYVDPNVDPESLGLTPDSVLWVGAWWIGFLMSGSMALIVSLPLLGFPKYLPGAQNIDGQLDQYQTQKGSDYVAQSGWANTVRDIPRATLNLITNAPFMLLNCGSATEWFIISCLAAFGPKFYESQFSMSSSDAAFQAGLIVIPSSCMGSIIGAYIVKHFKMSFSGMVKFCIGSLLISLICIATFIFSCPDPSMAGATVQYNSPYHPLTEKSTTNFTAKCNSDCHCSTDYNPVCGSDNIIYYSACYAGCRLEESGAGDQAADREYIDCSCIPGNGTDAMGSATLGLCPTESCLGKTPFIAGLFLMLAFTFFALVPSILATMRSVSHSQRAYGLGIQSFIYRLLGAIPGPIVLGALIDRVCLVWETDCDGSRNCWLYDNANFSKILLITTAICRCLTIVFMALALYFYVPLGNMDEEDDERKNDEEEDDEKTIDDEESKNDIKEPLTSQTTNSSSSSL